MYAGDLIGYVGSTGRSGDPYLQFEGGFCGGETDLNHDNLMKQLPVFPDTKYSGWAVPETFSSRTSSSSLFDSMSGGLDPISGTKSYFTDWAVFEEGGSIDDIATEGAEVRVGIKSNTFICDDAGNTHTLRSSLSALVTAFGAVGEEDIVSTVTRIEESLGLVEITHTCVVEQPLEGCGTACWQWGSVDSSSSSISSSSVVDLPKWVLISNDCTSNGTPVKPNRTGKYEGEIVCTDCFCSDSYSSSFSASSSSSSSGERATCWAVSTDDTRHTLAGYNNVDLVLTYCDTGEPVIGHTGGAGNPVIDYNTEEVLGYKVPLSPENEIDLCLLRDVQGQINFAIRSPAEEGSASVEGGGALPAVLGLVGDPPIVPDGADAQEIIAGEEVTLPIASDSFICEDGTYSGFRIRSVVASIVETEDEGTFVCIKHECIPDELESSVSALSESVAPSAEPASVSAVSAESVSAEDGCCSRLSDTLKAWIKGHINMDDPGGGGNTACSNSCFQFGVDLEEVDPDDIECDLCTETCAVPEPGDGPTRYWRGVFETNDCFECVDDEDFACNFKGAIEVKCCGRCGTWGVPNT